MLTGELAEAGRLAETLTSSVRLVMQEAAEKALLRSYRKLAAEEIEEKEPGELVTNADRESEAILADRLCALLPEAEVIGEEAAHRDPALLRLLGGPLSWIVDPLDGTGHYAAGEGPFGIIVALAVDGLTVGGWILEPISGRFSCAALAHGARIDCQQVTIARPKRPRPLLAASPLLLANDGRRAIISARLGTTHDIIEIPRCAAYHYPEMVLGLADASLFERTLAWDHAAGILLVEEAGGRCARLDGTSYRTDQQSAGLLVAADEREWDYVANRVADLWTQ